jgi:alpha-ribazole phosphatase/probable phosphoglycerate mutase
MTEILLIRHPQTDLAGTFCGHTDPPINTAGGAQLRALLATLEAEPLDAVYTSDLDRAQTLAQAIASRHQVACIGRAALREIHEEAAAWLANFPHQAAPNGETFADFQARVLHEFDRILATRLERIAIVTHAGVMRTILTARCGVDESAAHALTKPYCSLIRHNLMAAPQ